MPSSICLETQWEPPFFLLQMQTSLVVHGVEQMSYEYWKKVSIHYDNLDQQKKLWIRSFEEKKKHIENAKKYVGEKNVSRWDVFFIRQRNIIDYHLQSRWPLTLSSRCTLCSHIKFPYKKNFSQWRISSGFIWKVVVYWRPLSTPSFCAITSSIMLYRDPLGGK